MRISILDKLSGLMDQEIDEAKQSRDFQERLAKTVAGVIAATLVIAGTIFGARGHLGKKSA